MSSYRYYLVESDNTEGVQDTQNGMTYFLPPDTEQLFTLQPRFWKDENEACNLQPQDLIDSKSHTFKTKVFKHPNTCQVCNEVIWNEGRTCRVCKYACHRKCEYKVTAACKPSVNYALPSNGDTRPQQTQLKFSSPPLDSNRNKMTAHVHAEVAKHPSGGDAYIRYSFDLDVDYITERLIAVSFPAGGLEAQYRSNLRDVVRMLRSKHQDKYVVFNLSQRRHDINQLNPQVYDLGWPDHLAPSLEKLCSICKHIETWLKADPHNIVVLHCKGGRGPIGVVVLAYMNYINITSNLETAMDRYAMKRFMEAKTESAMHPSQHRYVNYFTGLLTKSIQVNSAPLFLHHVLIHGVPNYDINGGCRPFLRVYQGMQPIFTSGVYSVPEGTSRFAVSLDQALPIRGDILVKCYHKKFRATTRDVVFRCQFHTTAIMECRLVFQKSDLDDACTDARFPDFTKVEFIFSHTPDQLHGSDYVPGNNFPVDERNDPLIRWDSYENFDKTVEGGDYTPEVIDLSVSMNNNIPHSSAPDGSLYAEVQKTPSPIQQEKLFFTSPSSSGPTSPVGSNQLLPVIPNALDFDTGPRSSMQTTQLAVLRAKMNAQMDPSYQTIKRRTPSPRTPTSDPPSPIQPPTPSVQFANGPQQPNNVELSNGPESSKTLAAQRREMNYKEKRDLDDLLRGIGEDVPALSSPDSIGSGEVGEKRKIVDVQAQMSHLPPLESRHSPTARVHHPQSHGVQGELENPYAEISDAVPKQDQLHGQVRKQDPLEEKITRSQVGEVESSRIPDVQVHRTAQLHDNPTYAVTKESKQYTPDSRPHDVADLGHGMTPGQQLNTSPGYPSSAKHSDIWQPQPLRAKKEQLMYIYQEDPTSPLGPAASPSPGDNAVKLPEGSDMTKTPTGSNRTSSEIGDDAMTWLQRQQQKLKEKRLREEAVTQPTYQTPKRELPKAPEPRQEPVFEKAPQAVVQPQVQAPREQMPTDNLSWLEEKQRELQMRRGQMDPSPKPLFIDTSHPGSSYGSSFSPPRTDFSGVSTSSAANGPLPRPQLTDLEKSTNEQFSPKATADPGPLTPPNTYEHDSGPHAEAWQAHRRPLNRQTSDITYDREQQVVVRQRLDMERAPQAPTHGVTSLPPAGPHSTTPKDSAGQQAPLQNASGPVRDAYKVDLHIDESNMEDALNHEGRVANRIADITSKQSDQPKSQPPTGPRVKPAKVKQVTRRTPYQSGYDSDSAINQYYDPPSNRVGRESPERWLHNPGGLPDHENEYWDRMEGLKTPNLKEQWIRKPEFDIESSNESLPNGSVTPKFPVGPKAYKNMIWTPLATVRPPHGPDDPYPLSPTRHNNRDILDTTGLHISPAQQASTQAASPVNVEGPTMNAAQSTTPATPEVITVTQRRIVQTERVFDQNGLPEVLSGPSAKEATVQQPIMAKVERVPTPVSQVERKAVQNGQHYPVEARVERVPVASVQESSVKAKPVSMRYPAGVFPPSPKKEVTFQDARGGVPERPTGPQALVEEKEIVPTVKKPVEVAPVWPIELEVHIKNEGISPAVGEVQVKSGVATPPNRPQQLSPSSQNRTQFVQEPPTQQEVIKKEQTEPKFSYQLQNLASQPPPPLYPTYSDRMKNRPPGPMYPTFSDRHRKAAAGRVEEVSPQVANGYHTMYDNRGVAKAKRASTGSEGMWPAHPTHQRKASDGNGGSSLSGRTTPSNFYLMQQPSPYSSSVSLADTSMDKVRFVKDLSAWWYKPHISRDEAIAMLKDKCPGQFVVRDSNSFPGAFGLAVKVAQLPPNAPPSKKATDPASELVRHFLIEPNPRGVRLKGCANEPIFGSLSALIYQHTLTQLALPCKLLLPESDPSGVDATDSAIDPKSAHALLSQGAACNVIFLGMMEMESLTGPSAVREATNRLINLKEKPKRVVVHFKVSLKGITLTDNQRKLFFRRHYPVQSVLYCGMDSGARKWKRKDGVDETQARIFGFISRKPGSKTDNQCHLFAEYEMEQPASAIVSFVTKVLLGSSAQS
ncbi:tensin-2-like isoform X9 [Acanthaster planci]|uniref:Tensin-2-like isoform X9 n=1 Tax=Acanthaster planci TaxID=133434 RepID=A0A8B7XHI4_ACAPL|nr:tensin-2-like isoform X9 [Acanthaster planci]